MVDICGPQSLYVWLHPILSKNILNNILNIFWYILIVFF